MIDISNISNEEPYKVFVKYYKKALIEKQKAIDAVCISSFDTQIKEINARFVNLKFVSGCDWIFFSNYRSPKAAEFEMHNQISATIYWQNIDTQIRMKAKIKKTSEQISDDHYKGRDHKKNALAISSKQSQIISSYKNFKEIYNKTLKEGKLNDRPDYWGGYSFVPHSFEFWEGHKNRINKRCLYKYEENIWKKFFLQP